MVNKYELNWAGLALDVPTPDLALVGTMALLDENGNSLSLSKTSRAAHSPTRISCTF